MGESRFGQARGLVKGGQNPSLLNLEPSRRSVSIRLPESLPRRLKELAKKAEKVKEAQ